MPAARPDQQRCDLVLQAVLLRPGVQRDRAVNGIDQVRLAFDTVPPGRRVRILEIGHEHPGARVQGVDHHLPLDRTRDLDPPIEQIARRLRHRELVKSGAAAWHSVRIMRGAPTQRLYVEEHGEGEPLLLIEGLGQSMWAWREQVPLFARHYRTIAFDARGTGRSHVPDEPYGIDELAQDAANILDERSAYVVGLSMGGYTALTLALARPELVRSLVL